MKKLFATLLAATMVAGTAVSAFAYDDAKATKDGKNYKTPLVGLVCSDDDYTLGQKVFTDKGIEIGRGNQPKSGDKIYYPILVSGAELDKGTPEPYYFATAASEIEDLKVTLKAVRGGKYIKGSAIVRKDLDGDKASKEIKDLEAKLAQAKKVVADAEANKGATQAQKDAVKAAEAKLKEAQDAVTAADKDKTDKLNTAIAEVKKVDGTFAGTTLDDVNQKINDLKTAGKTDDDLKAAKTAAEEADKATGATQAQKDAVKAAEAKLKEAQDAVTAADKGATQAQKDAVTAAQKELDDAKKAVTDGTAKDLPKMYFVEVEFDDYYGTKETEVEFDLTLRTRSTQYETKDASIAPMTAFDLGKDAVEGTELKHGQDLFINGTDKTTVKFRNGELTLGINKYTGSIKLEEAYTSADKLEDIERIFLEGDDFDYEVKASSQGELYLEYNQDANKKVIIANQDAKMDFFNFPGKPEFDFTGDAKFTVEDPEKNYYFYEIVDDKPVKTSAKYDKEDECFVLRTRTLGSYVISDKELKAAENPADKDADKPATDKPTTETPVNPTTPGKNVPTGAIA